MMPMTLVAAVPASVDQRRGARVLLNTLLVGLIAFLTVVDLLASQAILPALTRAYATTPALMSSAVNTSTIGIAAAGLAMAVLGRRIYRRLGIFVSIVLLFIPNSVAVDDAQYTSVSPVLGSCRACNQ